MNVVLDETFEVNTKNQTERIKTPIGRIMLKGENISLICSAEN